MRATEFAGPGLADPGIVSYYIDTSSEISYRCLRKALANHCRERWAALVLENGWQKSEELSGERGGSDFRTPEPPYYDS